MLIAPASVAPVSGTTGIVVLVLLVKFAVIGWRVRKAIRKAASGQRAAEAMFGLEYVASSAEASSIPPPGWTGPVRKAPALELSMRRGRDPVTIGLSVLGVVVLLGFGALMVGGRVMVSEARQSSSAGVAPGASDAPASAQAAPARP